MGRYDVIIVGGGLAGLTAAIHLCKVGHAVLVIEKKEYPHHKVCGEYVSNEIVPYLEGLGIRLGEFGAMNINSLLFSTVAGDFVTSQLPLGGKGISRYAFDYLLYQRALSIGATFIFQNVTEIDFQINEFKVVTGKNQTFTSTFVIGAYGKRGNLDRQLQRDFMQQRSSWLGVKAHYKYDDFPDNLVALHNFKGGYGGLSKTESGAINFCYLTQYESFHKEKNVESFNHNVVSQNPFLATFLKQAEPLFDAPLTIAQISFKPKKAVTDHVLMTGDTAGLIHPLCGNGMAMAIHSAKIASELIHKCLMNPSYQRQQLERDYQKEWNKTFKQRLWVGRRLQTLLLSETLSTMALATAVKLPRILRKMITYTHGEPVL